MALRATPESPVNAGCRPSSIASRTTCMSGVRHHRDQPPIRREHLLDVSQCVSIARACSMQSRAMIAEQSPRRRPTLRPGSSVAAEAARAASRPFWRSQSGRGRLLSDHADGVVPDAAQRARDCVDRRESGSLRLRDAFPGSARTARSSSRSRGSRSPLDPRACRGHGRAGATGRRDVVVMLLEWLSSRRRAHLYTPHTLSSSGRTTA